MDPKFRDVCNWAPANDLQNRLDAPYYSVEAVANAKWMQSIWLGKVRSLESITSLITDGTHVTPNYMEAGVPFLSATNVDPCSLNIEKGIKHITLAEHNVLKKGNCSPNTDDILVAKSGRIGQAAVNHLNFDYSVFESVAIVRLSEDTAFDPDFLAAYLNTKYAQDQISRMQKGAVQKHLHLEDLREIQIPKISEDIQTYVGNCVRKACLLLDLAVRSRNYGEDLLNATLGFQEQASETRTPTWAPVAGGHGRLDAEYYGPEYLRFDEFVAQPSASIVEFDSFDDLTYDGGYGVLPSSEDYGTGTLRFLRAQDIGDFVVDCADPIVVPEDYRNNKAMTRENDILLEVKGAISGGAICPAEAVDCLVNGSVYRACVRDSINPYYFVSVLLGNFGVLQKRRAAANSIISYLSAEFIGELLIPRLGLEIEDQIGDSIRDFVQKTSEATVLINQALAAVSQAIEQTFDETNASKSNDKLEKWLSDHAKEHTETMELG